jgi:predicted XRE-type DNA-binding protein
MPFVLVSTAGSLEYLRSYGFQTFDSIWDESYDLELDDDRRLARIADLLHSLDQLTDAEKQAKFEQAIPIIEHNFNHFYSGAFEQILWQELVDMLNTMQRDFEQ